MITIRSLATYEVIGAHAASIARSCVRLAVGRIRRTPSHVAAEYDRGHWARIYGERAWERAKSLEDYLVGTDQHLLTARVDGRTCSISRANYYRYRLGALAGLVESSLGSTQDLVELGSGYGYNLLSLSLAFPKRRFLGLEISPSGVAAARAAAAHFGLQGRIEFDVIDLTDPNHPNYSKLSARAVLTHFCVEQLPMAVGSVLQSIAGAKPSRVLHLEPAGELLSLWRPADWANLLYVRSVHYQTSLLGELDRMRVDGEIELIRTERLLFAPTVQQIGLLALWRPREGGVPLDQAVMAVPHQGTSGQ